MCDCKKKTQNTNNRRCTKNVGYFVKNNEMHKAC